METAFGTASQCQFIRLCAELPFSAFFTEILYRNSLFPAQFLKSIFHLKIKAEFEKVFFTRALANEKLYNFHVLGKTQFGLYRTQIIFLKQTWPCSGPKQGQSRILVKTEAVGASFCKSVRVVHKEKPYSTTFMF